MEGQPAGVDEEIHHRRPEVVGLSMLLVVRRTPWPPFPPHTHWASQVVKHKGGSDSTARWRPRSSAPRPLRASTTSTKYSGAGRRQYPFGDPLEELAMDPSGCSNHSLSLHSLDSQKANKQQSPQDQGLTSALDKALQPAPV